MYRVFWPDTTAAASLRQHVTHWQHCTARPMRLVSLSAQCSTPWYRPKSLTDVQQLLGQALFVKRCGALQVRTILSQNTTDVTSQRAFAALKDTFPTWQAVREAQAGARPGCSK